MPDTIALIHNFYRQPGGEDRAFETEAALLRSRGHRVVEYVLHNSAAKPVALAFATVWNPVAYRELRALFRDVRPQVAHFHNTFPLISPSAYDAARVEQVPVVQTLHNYRLVCPGALLFRDGRPCKECIEQASPWPGVMHGCYRGSRVASAGVAAMIGIHRARGTWVERIDAFIALTEFARQKFVDGGLPEEKIWLKPNSAFPDSGAGDGSGRYALSVGRLSREKGVQTLLDAWKLLRRAPPLKIVGNGPLASAVGAAAASIPGVEWLGERKHEEVGPLMRDALVLICPSLAYECFPMAIVEAYAAGLPVIASDLGSMACLVGHGRTGLRFRPGDPRDLAAKLEDLLADPQRLRAMRKEARAEFESLYNADRNYSRLMQIYQSARSTVR